MFFHAHKRWKSAMAFCVVSIIVETDFLAKYSGESTISSKEIVTPIRNFGPSWTASSVGGSTIAIPFALKDIANGKYNKLNGTDAVVLIFRTIETTTWSPSNYAKMDNCEESDSKSTTVLCGLRIVGPIYKSADAIPLGRASQRWTLLGSTAICSMTGFAPDIDYLTRFLQKSVEDHRATFEGTSLSRTARISTVKLVEGLAEELQEAGQWRGGRPFGVQVLIVGQDSAMGEESSFGVYTLDPSGGYRRWRGGTAIGRNGKTIRQKMFEYWLAPNSNKFDSNDDGESALFVGLRASILSQSDASKNLERSDRYEALLIWQTKAEFCTAQINQSQINEMREFILTELTEGDKE